jgi:YgiT-type zinc finger domain-containing protein
MNAEGLSITSCPTCGSSAIRKIRGSWTGTYKGQTYSVQELEYYSCPNCQEKVYPPEAMRLLQQASPAYVRPGVQRAARRATG